MRRFAIRAVLKPQHEKVSIGTGTRNFDSSNWLSGSRRLTRTESFSGHERGLQGCMNLSFAMNSLGSECAEKTVTTGFRLQ